MDRTYRLIRGIASALIGYRGQAAEERFVAFADRRSYGFSPDRGVTAGREDLSHVPNNATNVGLDGFQMALSLAPGQQVIREALGNLYHLVFEGAARPV